MQQLDFNEIAALYREARKKLIIADYDGTLVGFEPRPELASPSQELLAIIDRLTQDPALTFAVVSGRDHETLGSWFEGRNVYLASEHGYMRRAVGGEWQSIANVDTSWKREIRKVMDHYVVQAAGTFVEEKRASLCWHFRTSESDVSVLQDQMLDELMPIVREHGLSLLSGKKLVEVRQNHVNKGHVAKDLINELKPNFALIAGDDQTDEDMLATTGDNVYTLKIGNDESAAKYRVDDYSDFLQLLNQLHL